MEIRRWTIESKIPSSWKGLNGCDVSLEPEWYSNKSGIYIIICKANGRVYIGSAKHIGKRWSGHRGKLLRGHHHSRHLQNSWAKHGESEFIFAILEFCRADQLIEREYHYLHLMEAFDSRFGFNTQRHPNAWVSPSGFEKQTQTIRRFHGRTRSSEERQRVYEKVAKPVVQISLTGTVVRVWSSVMRASEGIGKRPSNIRGAIKHPSRTVNDFFWRRLVPGCVKGSEFPGWVKPFNPRFSVKKVRVKTGRQFGKTAKLTEKQVRQIRMLNDKFGFQCSDIHPLFTSVNFASIFNVITRRTWKQVA